MPVFALSSDNQGDSLTFGVVVLICLPGISSMSWSKAFFCFFFGTAQLINS